MSVAELDFVQALNGMFAIAIWDRRNQRLVLARDRMGVKPMVYSLLPDGIVFASEIDALLTLQPSTPAQPPAAKPERALEAPLAPAADQAPNMPPDQSGFPPAERWATER